MAIFFCKEQLLVIVTKFNTFMFDAWQSSSELCIQK